MSYAERTGLASGTCAICGHRCHRCRICIHCKRRWGLSSDSTKSWPRWARWLNNDHAMRRYYEGLWFAFYSPYPFAHCTRGYGTRSAEEVVLRRLERAERDDGNGRRCAALLARLPIKERMAVVMRYYHDLTYAEIGAAMGYTGVWARKLVGRGLEKAREDNVL